MANSIVWEWCDTRTTPSGINWASLNISAKDVLEFDPRQTFISLDTNSFTVGGGYTPQQYDLSQCSVIPLFGKIGYLAPQLTLIEDKVPQLAGSVLRQINIEPRRIDLPFLLRAPDYSTLINLFRTLVNHFILARESGMLVFNRGQPTERVLYCTYLDGMMGDDNDDNQFIVWSKVMLSFIAHDPYYYSVLPMGSIVTSTETPVDFLTDGVDHTVFFPATLAPSGFSDVSIITNSGDADTYPIWLIEGPFGGTELTIKNQTTGKSLTLTGVSEVIQSGERVMIDTRPGFKSVISSFDGDIFGRLTNTSSLWSIPSGDNSIIITCGTTTSASKIDYKFDVPYYTY